jgi:cell division protein FtsX
VLGFIFNEAMRDLRRAGRVGVSAILLIALSLTALGGFWLLSLNLGRAIAQWGDRVRVIVYLKDEPPAARLEELLQRIEAVGGVQRLRFVSKAEALRVLKRSLGSQADVAEQLPRNPLPASVEVTPDAAMATPEGTRALVSRLAALPEVEEVQGGSQWVDGLAQFRRLFQGVGLAVGAVLALLLGNPLSGLTSAPEMLPTGWGTLGQWLPQGATATLLRSTAYFDGAGATTAIAVLICWAIAGVALIMLAAVRQRRSVPA